MTGRLQDLRYSSGQLRKAPGLTVVADLIRALGIGTKTAIYSLLDQRHLERSTDDLSCDSIAFGGGMLSTLLPAQRAASVDPWMALGYE